MKFFLKIFFVILVSGLILACSNIKIYAIEDPFARPNNFIGIHILFPTELDTAKLLVNSSGGDWGYVTIPIQAGDRDLVRWQLFMDACARDHLIPIIRLATQANWQNTATWSKPTYEDIVDDANFLASLNWPTKNRYIILFNEENRFDEWGGETPDPKTYADLVNFAVATFKGRSSDFFMILGGLDNAAPNDGVKYLSDGQYLADLSEADATVFQNIDGFASHSYPNPGFSAAPSAINREGVATYKFEYDFINSYSNGKKIPVFLTETGWDAGRLGDAKVSSYFLTTMTDIWEKDRDKIVAITPFLLESDNSVFGKFTFLRNGQTTLYYKTVEARQKIKGDPEVNPTVAPTPTLKAITQVLGVKTSYVPPTQHLHLSPAPVVNDAAKLFLKTIFGYGSLW